MKKLFIVLLGVVILLSAMSFCSAWDRIPKGWLGMRWGEPVEVCIARGLGNKVEASEVNSNHTYVYMKGNPHIGGLVAAIGRYQFYKGKLSSIRVTFEEDESIHYYRLREEFEYRYGISQRIRSKHPTDTGVRWLFGNDVMIQISREKWSAAVEEHNKDYSIDIIYKNKSYELEDIEEAAKMKKDL